MENTMIQKPNWTLFFLIFCKDAAAYKDYRNTKAQE